MKGTLVLEYSAALSPAPISDSEKKEYIFIASTPREDALGRSVALDGWVLDRYHKNPVVFAAGVQHDWNNLPVAKGRPWIDQHRQALMMGVTFASTLRAREVEQLVNDGVLSTGSVGWIPLEPPEIRRDNRGLPKSLHYKKNELVEFTLIGTPANPDAVRVASITSPDLDSLFIYETLQNLKKELSA